MARRRRSVLPVREAPAIIEHAHGYARARGEDAAKVTDAYLDQVRRVLVALDQANSRLSYKCDADTLGGCYGEGVATYVSQAGSLDFEHRRPSES